MATTNPMKQAENILASHKFGVLATCNKGRPNAAAVHYVADGFDDIYIMIESSTTKAKNLLKNPYFSLAIINETKIEGIQLHGTARIVLPGDDEDIVLEKHPGLSPHGYQDWVYASAEKRDFVIYHLKPDILTLVDPTMKDGPFFRKTFS